MALYVGVGMIVWAWVRLGRDVCGGTATVRQVHIASAGGLRRPAVATAVTRDVVRLPGQGALARAGWIRYQVGPSTLPRGSSRDTCTDVTGTTPAPYGPLFILIAKTI